MSFAGLALGKPAKFQGHLNTLEKAHEGMLIDGFCWFDSSWEIKNTRKFYRMEQNDNNVENPWKSPQNNVEGSHAQAQNVKFNH